MIDLIRSYEATKPKQHPVGMTVPYPTVPQGTNVDVMNSTADWISMNGSTDSPAEADGSKVSLSDTDHLCGICGDAAWPWKSLMRGHNTLFMDGYDGSAGVGDPVYNPTDPKWETIRKNMGYARSYALRMDLAHALPHSELAGSTFCLANPGSQYLVYSPGGVSVSLNLSAVPSTVTLTVEWFSTSSGAVTGVSTVMGGGTRQLKPPAAGGNVVFVH
jgi:Putative collagen-binding domain of a collagenase